MDSPVKIMGIVNINGDSFFSGSRVASVEEFCERVERLFAGGADVVDIGACSSRPGSDYPGVEEEWRRLEPVLGIIKERYLEGRPYDLSESVGADIRPDDTPESAGGDIGPDDTHGSAGGEISPNDLSRFPLPSGIRFSIDTFSSEIVRRAFCAIGPFIVNDITSGQSDPGLLPLVARLDLPYIAMHNENPPQLNGMPEPNRILASPIGDRPVSGNETGSQSGYRKDDIVERVMAFFSEFERRAAAAGLNGWILDPGFGFGKDVEENLELLDRLDELKAFGREILAGISRKRMTYERQGRKPEDDGTLAETRRLQDIAVARGAAWLRVHDVI